MSDVTPLDRLVAEVARRESAGLLDAAVAQAKGRVHDDLAQRLTDAITAELAATATGLAQSTVDTVAAVPDGRPATEHGLYAYGIVRDGGFDLAANGIGSDRPAWVVTRDGLGLVVSDIRLADLAGLDAEEPVEDSRLAEFARGHDAVVRAVFDQTPILPLRFGTVLTDPDAAAELLARQREDALATLARIAGKREWGAKVLRTASAPAEPGGAAADPAPSGTEYLARKRSELAARQAAREHRRETLDRVHGALAEPAADDVRRASAGENVLLDSAFLVSDTATDDFLTRVDEIARELAGEDLALRATGPWPPYSFAVLEERTGA